MTIVIKVELWPGGDGRRAKTIGTAEIANVSNLAAVSDYLFEVQEEASAEVAKPINCRGRVLRHYRSQSVWMLVRAVVNAAFHEASVHSAGRARGGYARAAGLSKERRVEIARNAAKMRWGKNDG